MKPARQTSATFRDFSSVATSVEVVPRLELAVIHHQRLDAGLSRVLEPQRVGAVGDDYRNARVEPAVFDGANQRHVAAAPGNQDADGPMWPGRWGYLYRTPAPS